MPFPDKYFDIIHTARLAIHIPEDIVCIFIFTVIYLMTNMDILSAPFSPMFVESLRGAMQLLIAFNFSGHLPYFETWRCSRGKTNDALRRITLSQ